MGWQASPKSSASDFARSNPCDWNNWSSPGSCEDDWRTAKWFSWFQSRPGKSHSQQGHASLQSHGSRQSHGLGQSHASLQSQASEQAAHAALQNQQMQMQQMHMQHAQMMWHAGSGYPGYAGYAQNQQIGPLGHAGSGYAGYAGYATCFQLIIGRPKGSAGKKTEWFAFKMWKVWQCVHLSHVLAATAVRHGLCETQDESAKKAVIQWLAPFSCHPVNPSIVSRRFFFSLASWSPIFQLLNPD